jgi:hypothetical protein
VKHKGHNPPKPPSKESKATPPQGDDGIVKHNSPPYCAPWWKRVNWQLLVEIAVFLVGVKVAFIYSGQLRQMIESNDINRENVESVERALVFFSGQAGYVKRLTRKKVTSLTIILPWENSGVTPAINGLSVVNWKTFPSPSGIPGNFTYPDEANPAPKQFEIPPKGYGNGTMDVPITWIAATKDKRLRMFIYGWITYDDIFKGTNGRRKTSRHLSEFCDEIVNIKSTPDDLTDPSANITWELSLCREHNCSDERCMDYEEKTHLGSF